MGAGLENLEYSRAVEGPQVQQAGVLAGSSGPEDWLEY